jgi:hypothetical protein
MTAALPGTAVEFFWHLSMYLKIVDERDMVVEEGTKVARGQSAVT